LRSLPDEFKIVFTGVTSIYLFRGRGVEVIMSIYSALMKFKSIRSSKIYKFSFMLDDFFTWLAQSSTLT